MDQHAPGHMHLLEHNLTQTGSQPLVMPVCLCPLLQHHVSDADHFLDEQFEVFTTAALI
jgi:hypothetical protein